MQMTCTYIFKNIKPHFLKPLFLLLIGLVTYSSSFAQAEEPEKCATVPYELSRLGEKYPQYFEAFEEYIRNQRDNLNGESINEVYTIPIVFHVIHDGNNIGSGDNIGKQFIDAQLEQLNNDFRKVMGTSGFGAGVDTRIEFCAATVDENGNSLAEPGINRIDRNDRGWTAPPYDDPGFLCLIFSTDYINNTIKPQSIWDPEKYCNVWVLQMECLLGFAQFPEAPDLGGIGTGNGGANTDGVVVSSGSVGSTELPAAVNIATPPYDKGRTLSHELGHWFGLRHIWGDGDCSVDDFCADTPNANGSTRGCPNNKDTCPGGGPDQIENYMDYSDDTCMDLFTADQKARMDIVMGRTGNGSPRRAILINSTACGGGSANPEFALVVNDNSETVTPPSSATYNFDINFSGGYSGSVTMSVVGLAAGASANFSTNPITSPGTYSVTINGTQNLAFGSYNFDLQAADGSDTQTEMLTLNVQDPNQGGCNTLVSTDVPKAIPQNATVTSIIVVPDFGSITDINVRMNGDHTRARDLTFELRSPSGTTIELIDVDDPCNGGGDNFNLGFDDESSLTIGSDLPCPPTDGNDYQPDQDLSTFDGEEVNGTWTLLITDVRTEVGTLQSWSLEYCISGSTGGCVTDLVINDNPIDAATYQASVSIESAGRVTNGSGGAVVFEAGDFIQLNPGFRANGGTSFIARIATCVSSFNDEEESFVEARSEENVARTNSLKVFPNPFRDQTNVELDLVTASLVSIEVYDLTGKRVRVVANNMQQDAGQHTHMVDASSLENGMYILLVRIGDEVKAQKISIIR